MPCLASLDNVVGTQAARADGNAFVAAVDDRLDRLQVRLEPSRAHVVRVAMLPADDRAFPAQFTSLRHKTALSFQLSALSAIAIRVQLSALGSQFSALGSQFSA